MGAWKAPWETPSTPWGYLKGPRLTQHDPLLCTLPVRGILESLGPHQWVTGPEGLFRRPLKLKIDTDLSYDHPKGVFFLQFEGNRRWYICIPYLGPKRPFFGPEGPILAPRGPFWSRGAHCDPKSQKYSVTKTLIDFNQLKYCNPFLIFVIGIFIFGLQNEIDWRVKRGLCP